MEYKSGIVRTEEFEMGYVSFGKGQEALVILPGMSLHPVTEAGAGVASAYAAFTEKYTVTLFDRVKEMPDPYPIEAMARDTARAMEELGMKKADVFGASQGGMIAQALAVLYPEKVGRLVLGSTGCGRNPLSDDAFETWSALARMGDRIALNRDAFGRIYSEAYLKKYKSAFDALTDTGTPEELRRFAVQAEANLNFDLSDRLGQIRAETLVIGSFADGVFGGEEAFRLAREIGAELCVFPGFSHAGYDENPEYKARMLAFLTK